MAKTLLLMKRNRVINFAPHLVFQKMSFQSISLAVHLQSKLIPNHPLLSRTGKGQSDPRRIQIRESVQIISGILSAPIPIRIKVGQLLTQKCRLQSIDPKIPTNL